jgi:hypothetical protein
MLVQTERHKNIKIIPVTKLNGLLQQWILQYYVTAQRNLIEGL